MRQIKFFIGFEKEEQWLNEMAKRGYALVGKSIAYAFERAEPEDAVIKVDFRQFKSRADFEDYLALFEDSGWKHVAGSKSSGSQYFRKVDETVSDDIFSDADSRAGRYQRLSRMWFSLACCYIPIFVAMVSTGLVDAAAFTHPKALYYTPGLWEKTGVFVLAGVSVRNAVCVGARLRLVVVPAADRALFDLLGPGQKPVPAGEIVGVGCVGQIKQKTCKNAGFFGETR